MTRRAIAVACVAVAVCASAATAVTMQAVEVTDAADRLLVPAWVVAIATSFFLGATTVLKLRQANSQPQGNGNGSSVESHALGKMEGMVEALQDAFKELTLELRTISQEIRKHSEEASGAAAEIAETHRMVTAMTKRARRRKGE